MKKFTKEQLTFLIFAIVAVLLLTYKTIGFGLISGLGAQNIKYQSSVDSIVVLEAGLANMQKSVLNTERDLFNFKTSRKAVAPPPVQQPVDGTVKPVVKKNFTYVMTIEPLPDLEILVTAEGKAKISVGGSARQIVVGDQVPCANGVEVEVDADSGEKTGKTRPAGVRNGVVTSIDKRNIYFSISGSSQGIKLNAREGAKLVDADMIPRAASSGTSEESGSEGNSGAPKVKRKR